ncbi:unnamed protein product, partial [Meganyctiphanes norvegica]
MSRKFVPCAIAVMVMVCAGRDDPTDKLTITQLRIPKDKQGKADTPLIVCYTADADTYKAPATLVGQDASGEGEGIVLQVETIVDPAGGCFTFENADVTTLPPKLIKLVLQASKGSDGAKPGTGIADVTFPSDPPSVITVDLIGKADEKKVIRLNADIGESVLNIDGHNHPCTSPAIPPCYFMDVSSTAIFDVCVPDIGTNTDTTDKVAFCTDVTSNPVTTVESDTSASGIQEITLDHNNAGNKISLKSTCLPLEKGCTIAELVVQKGATRVVKYPLVCPKLGGNVGALEGDCNLGEDIEEGESYKVFIAYTDQDGNALSFDQTTIINRNLVGIKLTTDIIEAVWSYDTTSNIDNFQISRDHGDEDGFAKADVDCSHMSSLCFVYFTGLVSNTDFILTLGIINNWPEVLTGIPAKIDPEQEKSDTINIETKVTSNSHMKDIEVEKVNLELNSTSMKALAHTCFHNVQETSCQTCRYEAILIDREGRWKKTKITPIQENHLYCFTLPLEKSNEKTQLDMVLVYRNISSGEALAAGSKIIDYSDLRITKPEMDDSSEGYTGTLAIVGAAIGGVACLIALVAVAVLF